MAGQSNHLLRHEWAMGRMSSARVLAHAHAAAQQGATSTGKLSSLSNSKHAHRDLLRFIGLPKCCPEISWVDFPMADGSFKAHPSICPIDLLETCARSDDLWRTRIVSDTSDIRDFWTGFTKAPHYRRIEEYIDTNRTLACGLHGDGAPTSKTQGLFTVAWNSYHTRGTTRATRNVYSVIRKSDVCEATMQALWARLARAFNALEQG